MRQKLIFIFDTTCEFSLYGLILLLPISKAAIEIFFGLMFISFLLKKILQPGSRIIFDPIMYFLYFFVIFSFISVLRSGIYFEKGMIALISKWLEYISIFVVTADILTDRRRVKRVLAVFFFGSMLVALDGILQFFSGFDLFRHMASMYIGEKIRALTASFQHYNDFAAYLLVSLSLLFAYITSDETKKDFKPASIFLLILMVFNFAFSFSRGAWLGILVSLILMLALTKKYGNFFKFAMVVIFMILVFFRSLQGLWLIFTQKSFFDRMDLWNIAFQMIKERPFFGKGLGTFMDYFKDYSSSSAQYAHNCFLQIWAESGIFSLLSFLGFVTFLFSVGIKAFLRSRDFLLLGSICALSGYLVHSFFDTHLYSLQLATLFWFVAGLSMALIRINLRR